MKMSKWLAGCLVSFCFVQQASAENDGMSFHKTISGHEANIFMDALEKSGVVDTEHKIGAKNFRVQSIMCSEAVVYHPKPVCKIQFHGSTLVAGNAESQILFSTLDSHGAKLPHIPEPCDDGYQTPHRVGVKKVGVQMVHCTKPVTRFPSATCSFDLIW